MGLSENTLDKLAEQYAEAGIYRPDKIFEKETPVEFFLSGKA